MSTQTLPESHPAVWNKGKLVGQKEPLRLNEICAIRVRLQLGHRVRELALFNLAIDSKLRAIVMQRKTRRPVRFEITSGTRKSIEDWMSMAGLHGTGYLFPSRLSQSLHLSTRQYARIVHGWVEEIGLDTASYGTHTMRRTKPTLICRRTKNLRAVQLLLGHNKIESTVRYLGIDVDDALELAEQTET